jgi:DNA-binding CsgD family transcriptional regulator
VLLSEADQNKWEQARQQGSKLLAGAVSTRVETPRHALKQPQRRLTSAEAAALAAEYVAGASTYELSSRWCINRDTVTLVLKKAGVGIRERGQLTPQQLEEARRLRAGGWSLIRLGRHFGIDPKTMKKRLTSPEI